MPTVLWIGPYRFFFYSREENEPPHIHIERDENVAKYWLEPVALASNHGFRAHVLTQLRGHVVEHRNEFLEAWHGTSAVELDATAIDVTTDESSLRVVLADGREVSVPLDWFPRLRDATVEQRKNWRFIGRGHGIHWADVDEDISVSGLLRVS